MYILDTETASLTGGICEIAWLRVNDQMEILDEFLARVNPERPIDPGATAVHKITDADVADKPTIKTIVQVIEPEPFVLGHNINFDVRMLKGVLTPAQTFCTLKMARTFWTKTTNHKLETLQAELNLPKQKSHSALGDVHTCRDLILATLDKTGLTFPELVERSRVKVLLKVMPYGKHKGLPILRVPKQYRDWLLQQDLDADLRYTLETFKDV